MDEIRLGEYVMMKKGLKVYEVYGGLALLESMVFDGAVCVECVDDTTIFHNGFYYSFAMLDVIRPGTKVKIKKYEVRPRAWNNFGKMDKYQGAVVTVDVICGSLFNIKEDVGENEGSKWSWSVEDIEEIVYPFVPDWKVVILPKDDNVTEGRLYRDNVLVNFATTKRHPCDAYSKKCACVEVIKRLFDRSEEESEPDKKFKERDLVEVVSDESPAFGYRGTILELGEGWCLVDFHISYPWTVDEGGKYARTVRYFEEFELRKVDDDEL